MSLKIRRLSHALGAEIMGVDITKPIDEGTFKQIYAVFLECNGILLIRGLPLTQDHHVAFSRWFGELDDNGLKPRDRHPQYAEIKMVTNTPGPDRPTGYTGEVWHSDQSYMCVPGAVSLLHAVEIPEVGGDTMFANMYLAYETLSEGMKKLIENMHGVHQGGQRRIDNSTPERAAETKKIRTMVAQPLVKVHPDTGQKSLYVGEQIQHLVGLSEAESRPFLDFLLEHSSRPQFVYRHKWQKDDLIVWDNRCTNHLAVGDYDRSKLRHMERTTVMGAPSGGYVYEDAA